jgi:hypothetical protein
MADAAEQLRFIPQIYPASREGSGLRRLRIRFTCIDFWHVIARAVGKRALNRVATNLLSGVCGPAGFCVRSTLR